MLRATSVLLCMFSVTSQICASSTVCLPPIVKILAEEYSKEETPLFELLKHDLRKYLDASKAHLEAQIKLAIATKNLKESYEELQRMRN